MYIYKYDVHIHDTHTYDKPPLIELDTWINIDTQIEEV